MKKRLKGLLGLWLAVVMVCGMMVMPSMAVAQGIYVYGGTEPITDGHYIDIGDPDVVYDIELDTDANIPLNQESFVQEIWEKKITEEGFVITGWNAWGVNDSGFVWEDSELKNLPGTYVLTDDTICAITEFGDRFLLEAIFGEGTGVYIGGQELPDDGYYQYDNGILTEGNKNNYNAYVLGDDTEGSYSLTLNGLDVENQNGAGIYSEGSLKLILKDKNNVIGADNDSGNSVGILVQDGDLTVSGDGTLTVSGGDGSAGSFGIGVEGTVTITGGTVNATGGAAGNENSHGIGSNGGITISGGTVTAVGGSSENGNSYGIGSTNEIIIGGSAKVTATGGDSEEGSSYGVGTLKSFAIGDSAELTATGGAADNGSSNGVGAYGININGAAKITAAGGKAKSAMPANGSIGLGSMDGVTISGSATVSADGADMAIGAVVSISIGDGTYTLYANGDVVNAIDDWTNIHQFQMMQGATSDGGAGDSESDGAGDSESDGAGDSESGGTGDSESGGQGGGSSGHVCSSECDVCGGCEDLKCIRGACKVKCTLLAMDFTDVQPGMWYEMAVGYAYHHGLMAGVGNKLFGVDDTTSRAMIVTILWNLEKHPVVNYQMQFEDVPAETWYTEAIRWAAAEGIVAGYSSDKFGPTDAITREQLATILWNYAQYKGYDVSVGENTNLLSYHDVFEVSEWAIPAMQWACGAGMIQGYAGNLMPLDNATRAQTASVLMNFCRNVVEN